MKKLLVLAVGLILLLAVGVWFWQNKPESPASGEDGGGTAPSSEGSMEQLVVKSTAFEDTTKIPAKYTCDGENVSPPLLISGVPEEAKSLALIVGDPDAPGGIFTHWLVWGISPETAEIGEGSVPQGAVEGANDFGQIGWGGPCPPSGSHRYIFNVYALDTTLDLTRGADKSELLTATTGHILASGTLNGLYR